MILKDAEQSKLVEKEALEKLQKQKEAEAKLAESADKTDSKK